MLFLFFSPCISSFHLLLEILLSSGKRIFVFNKINPMRILAVTNMYPSIYSTTSGIFVKEQIEGLRRNGINVRVLFVDRVREGMKLIGV